MIKRNSFILILASVFLVISAAGYLVHFLIFRDPHYMFFYLVEDLAFMPLQVLIVGLVIERLLSRRDTQAKLRKLNMVVGAFFSEVGNYLLRNVLDDFENKDEISSRLNISSSWTLKDFQKAAAFAHRLPMRVRSHSVDLEKLKVFLRQRREFVLSLLGNPSLLENDRFTDLLWAVTHLDEELEARDVLVGLPASDLEHIAGDIRRMYGNLASEWLDYVTHLKTNYGYLFSLILRTHPFQPAASAVVDPPA